MSEWPLTLQRLWVLVGACLTRMTSLTAGLALSSLFWAAGVHAAAFEIAVTPTRFEISGKSANRLGQSIEITNVGRTATELSLRTLDWALSAEGSVSYYDELRPNSCRPWVTLERRTIKVGAGVKMPFRFQIDVPTDAPRTECRFMLAIEGVEPAFKSLIEGGGASLSLPVNGRIAIAVYIGINGAEPKMELTQIGVKDIKGKHTPMVTVTNTGDAHGRLDGSLDAVDAKGVEFELAPEGTPIMPGQTRSLPMSPRTEPNQPPPVVTFPIKVKGTLDWERGSFRVNAEIK